MKSSLRFTVLLALSLFLHVSSTVSAQTRPVTITKWEYRTVSDCDYENAELFNELGDEGWELSGIRVATLEGRTLCTSYYFKRPKQANQLPHSSKCTLSLDQAPVIHGIRLGMNTNDLLELFPRGKHSPSVNNELGRAENSGLANLEFPSESGGNVLKYRVAVFDDRVVSIEAIYDFDPRRNYYGWTMQSWIAKLSETFKLPGYADWWSPGSKNERDLFCKDFEVHTRMGSSVRIRESNYPEEKRQKDAATYEKRQKEFKP